MKRVLRKRRARPVVTDEVTEQFIHAEASPPHADRPATVAVQSQPSSSTEHPTPAPQLPTTEASSTTADAIGEHLHDVSRQFTALSARVEQLEAEQAVLIDAIRSQRDRVYDGDGDEEAADAALYAALERVTGEDERPTASHND